MPNDEQAHLLSGDGNATRTSDSPLIANDDASVNKDSTVLPVISEADTTTVEKTNKMELPTRWGPILLWSLYCFLASSAVMIITGHIPHQKKIFFGSDGTANLVTSIFASVQGVILFFTTGIYGTISDVKGRRPIMVMSAFVCVIPLSLNCIFSGGNLWPWILSRNILCGLAGCLALGNTPMLFAMAADIYPEQQRSVPMVFVVSSSFFGIMTASIPTLAGWDIETTNIVAAFLGLANLFLVALFFEETLPASKRSVVINGTVMPQAARSRATSVHESEAAVSESAQETPLTTLLLQQMRRPLEPLRYVFSSPLLRSISLVLMCIVAPLSGSSDLVLYYLNDKLNFNSSETGMFITMVGVTYFALSLGVLPIMAKFLSKTTMLFVFMTMVIVNMMFSGFAWNRYVAYWIVAPSAGLPLQAVALLSDIASASATPDEQGIVQGTLGAFHCIGSAIAPLVMSGLFNLGGHVGFLPMPFVVGAVVAVIGLFLLAFNLMPLLRKLGYSS